MFYGCGFAVTHETSASLEVTAGGGSLDPTVSVLPAAESAAPQDTSS